MSLHILENDRLLLAISDHGAELSRVYDKKNNREVLFDADPAYWKRHAPILFPIVGAVVGGTYTVGGNEYSLSQHGFARDMEFTCEAEAPLAITHVLTDSEASHALYPYPFRLTVRHELEGNSIRVTWEVAAQGEEMYFKVGGHPAFVVPVLPGTALSDYFISLDNRKYVDFRLIAPGTGCVDNQTIHTLPSPDGTLPLSEELFAKDALIIEDPSLKTASLLFPDKTPYIRVTMHSSFPYFGIWKKPGAPFVCLEPWQGRTDNVDSPKEFSQKEGMLHLLPGERFSCSYSIEVC